MDNAIEKTNTQPKEIQPVNIDPDAPLMVQIMQMTQQGIKLDVEYINGLVKIKKEIEADEARKVYASAFAAAQADVGFVVKSRKNQQTNSNYAGLDDCIEMSKNVCTKHDFSITFSEGVTETVDHIRLVATVLHKDGHEKTYYYDVPLGGKGIKGVVNMTAIHAKATSVSYGQRYLLCMIWNIPTKDNDGNNNIAPPTPPVVQPPTEQEIDVINAICDKLMPPDGLAINYPTIRDILIGNVRHLLTLDKVVPASEWLMKYYTDPVLFMPSTSYPKQGDETPGQFE